MKRILVAGALSLAAAAPAAATTAEVSYYAVFLSAWSYEPTLTLRNTSTSESIVNYSMTIGDTDYVFDRVMLWDPGATIVTGDGSYGGASTTQVDLSYAGVMPGGQHQTYLRLNHADTGSVRDPHGNLIGYKSIFYNNGDAPNSEVSVTFSNGQTLTKSFEDVGGFHAYRMVSQMAEAGAPAPDPAPSAVPLPAGLPLLAAGLGALGLVRRRRRA